ncbi:MAG: hypothetical protein HUU02_10800 [Bacteroidetes bacterium]|nr:hypothetical protein [Bacteroidota bacterium]
MKIRNFLILLWLGVAGCVSDAPRDNPLDPQSDRYAPVGTLSGRLLIRNTATGVASAEIIRVSDGLTVRSDSAGFFSVKELPAGMQSFIAVKSNFPNDTFSVSIPAGGTATIVREMNSAPVVTMKQIVTHKIDYVEYFPRYYVTVSASVTDPNGITDLSGAWFAVSTYRFPMEYSPTTKLFSVTVEKDSFPTNSIEWLINKPLTIVSTDGQGATNVSDPFMVTRIIENTAAPITQDTTTGTPLFKWKPPAVSFNYTSIITVARRGTETTVWKYAGLLSFFEELQYPTDGSVVPLSAGNYFWTITIVDDFGNTSRSQESYFTVK